MPKLTNCEISYERIVKVADYETKKFAARFSVLVEDADNEDEVTELYGRQIVRFVEDKLGIVSEIKVPAKAVTKSPAASLPASAPATPAPSAVTPTAPPAASTAEGAPATETKAKGPGRPKKDKAAEAAVVDDFPEETAKATESALVITDSAIREAITRHVAQYQKPAEVRQLVQTFFPKKDGKVWQSQEIPQDRRQDFLGKLASLIDEAI